MLAAELVRHGAAAAAQAASMAAADGISSLLRVMIQRASLQAKGCKFKAAVTGAMDPSGVSVWCRTGRVCCVCKCRCYVFAVGKRPMAIASLESATAYLGRVDYAIPGVCGPTAARAMLLLPAVAMIRAVRRCNAVM